jgi:peroxiredoxin family protein
MKRKGHRSHAGLALVVASGDFERVHYALVMASAAVATNRPVILFLTMGAIRAVLAGAGSGHPGWHELKGEAGASAALMDAANRSRGVAGFEELLQAVATLGGKIRVCEMGLKALGRAAQDLRTDIPIDAEGGVVSLLADAEALGAALLFV